MRDTILIDVRGPNAQEAEDGAEIVFHRREPGGLEHFIKACWVDGSYSQWGTTTPVLGDNVEAVTAWARGITELKGMCRDEEDEVEEDEVEEDEVEDGGWDVGDRAYVGAEGVGGGIIEIITTGLTDADAGFARVKMQLDYWPVGDLWEGSVKDIDKLDDE